jgi:cytochrome c oxidase subunit 2
LPIGRTVNFALRTRDVLHSFWIPNLGGKRDLISNKTNYLWFTPDSSIASTVANGQCAEYCGDSHANMKFRVFTVSAADFDKWVASQKGQAAMMGTGATPPAPPAPPAGTKPAPKVAAKPAADTAKPVVTEAAYMYPGASVPDFTKPKTPYPAGLTFDDAVLAKGDADAGRIQYSKSMCIGCHMVSGNPMSQGVIGPNLTHLASRYTIAAGLFPNDAQHLARWIKNSRAMKPGVLMPTLGIGEWDPILKVKVGPANGGLTDQQIADIVAYLRALK